MNPFSLTKSADMPDDMIDRLWVDVDMIGLTKKLTSLNPVFLLGGKGSGKTHILRHYSYQLQTIRFNKASTSKIDGVKSDGYIGIYFRSKGLQADRFSGKGYPEDLWADLFCYAFELALGHELIFILSDLIQDDKLGGEVAKEIGELLELDVLSLNDLEKKVSSVRRKLYRAIANSALGIDLKNNNDTKILVTHGDLIYEIPKIIQKHISSLSTIPCIYMIDEMENFSSMHQKYINTLVREKDPETSIKIGARRYGIKTDLTRSDGEALVEGSEKETILLDDFYREDENKKFYKDFIYKLVENRIKSQSELIFNYVDNNSIDNLFENFSPSWNDEHFSVLVSKSKMAHSPYFKKFSKEAKSLMSKQDIEKVVNLLSVPDYPLLEKVNLYNFYTRISKITTNNYLAIAREINKDSIAFVSSDSKKNKTDTYRLLDHYKNNLTYQFRSDYRDKAFYSGMGDIIRMSEGMPRNALQILKRVYDWGAQLKENPFLSQDSTMFTLEVQRKAFKESSDWFFDDIRECENREKLKECISRLGQLLRINHYADLPKECSCTTVSVDKNRLSDKAKSMLTMAVDYSFLILADDSKDKNHQSNFMARYQLNRMLCPLWDLPLARRGTKQLSSNEAEVIFDTYDQSNEEFVKLRDRWEKETKGFSVELGTLI